VNHVNAQAMMDDSFASNDKKVSSSLIGTLLCVFA
jgi:hypothetical protein